jgi:hypothetical protein
VHNTYAWSTFSGVCFDSGSGVAFSTDTISGRLPNVTGIIGRPSSQADLTAENILAGKTILGVSGTAASAVVSSRRLR